MGIDIVGDLWGKSKLGQRLWPPIKPSFNLIPAVNVQPTQSPANHRWSLIHEVLMPANSSTDDADDDNTPPIELQAVSENTAGEHPAELNNDDIPPSNVAEAYPEGGYGWVVVASCFTLAYVNFSPSCSIITAL